MPIEIEERVTRLEEELAFQERRVESLHEALSGQQKQLDRLEALVRSHERKIAELEEALAEALGDGGPVNQPPPHYL